MTWKEVTGRKKTSVKVVCVMLVIALLTGTTAASAETGDTAYVASVGDSMYVSVTEAVAEANGSVVKLLADSQETVTVSGDLYLDLNGYKLAALTITDGTLYGMDSTTDDYDCSDGYGTIRSFTGSYETTHKSEIDGEVKRYLTVEQDEAVSFHRVYLGITHASLRPANAGVGYKAVFAGDEMVQAQLHETEAFGYTLQLKDFNPVSRWKAAAEFVSEKTVTLRLKNYDEINYGEADLFAAVQLKLSDGTVITSEKHSATLRQMVETVNGNTGNYIADQLEALADWIRTSLTMLTWQVENILNPPILASIQVADVIAEPGKSVQVPVQIANNPGVAGAKITMMYASELVLTAAVSGDAFAQLQYTGPGKFVSPCSFTWDSESGMVTENGTILVLTFDLPADAVAGSVYTLTCTYRAGDFYDEDLNDVDFEVISGSITVQENQSREHTVTFRDHDGTVLKTQTVVDGGKATAPEVPARQGYIFTGWDKSFDNVTSDLVVTAQYQMLSEAAFVVSNVTGEPGQTVQVPVTVVNNPGVAGAKLTMTYDSELTLTNAVNGEAFSSLMFTKSGTLTSPCSFTWDSESGMAVEDGTVLVLSFDIPADAEDQTYELICTYRVGDIYDEDLNDVNFEIISGSITVKAPEAVNVYTVTFRDHDGTVLKTETVTPGGSATAPADPERQGYIFTGWDKSFDEVTSDLVITAQYQQIKAATILVSNVTATPGQSVQVPVQIVNNPGVAGAKITMRYDSTLTLSSALNGEAFSYLQFTKSGQLVSPCSFTWDSESGMAAEDGTILVLTFDVPADATIGQTYDLICTYRSGDIYDEDLNDVDFEIISGSITIG